MWLLEVFPVMTKLVYVMTSFNSDEESKEKREKKVSLIHMKRLQKIVKQQVNWNNITRSKHLGRRPWENPVQTLPIDFTGSKISFHYMNSFFKNSNEKTDQSLLS